MRTRVSGRLFLPALAVSAVLAALAVMSALDVARPRSSFAAPPRPNWTTIEVSQFDILRGNRLLGTESLRIYQSGDTLITASTVRLDAAGPESALPLEKRLTYLRRNLDSFPLVFQVGTTPRDSTREGTDLNCIFGDTVATVFREIEGHGRVETVGLPPGKLYLFEPGVYLPVQLLLADFVAGSQDKRKQAVLIPSAVTVVDLYLTRTGRDTLVVSGRRVPTTRVEMTDNLTPFTAWIDDKGRLWKLAAQGQDLVVQRRPDPGTKKAPARKSGAPKPSTSSR
ncbi:MAG: hypothetical protein ACREOU_08770 [Candidatus Eiseniibacteriota bacterium]